MYVYEYTNDNHRSMNVQILQVQQVKPKVLAAISTSHKLKFIFLVVGCLCPLNKSFRIISGWR